MIRSLNSLHASTILHIIIIGILTQLALVFTTKNGIVEAKICVATAQDRFLCTDDASKAKAYKWKDAPYNGMDIDSWDFGIEQEIGGTQEEKDGVAQVMKDMKEYFENEVFAKSEYDSVLGLW
jgi:hypothetical protein